MDRDELILNLYKNYTEQKENFIDRNFSTNKFYMVIFIGLIFAMIYTSDVVFMNKITATLLFSIAGIAICVLWWMNVDTYNTIIKIKFANVIKKLEDNFPVKPSQEEYKGIEEFKSKKIFMFSDIQKIIAVVGAIFFFAIFVSEVTPFAISLTEKLVSVFGKTHGGI